MNYLGCKGELQLPHNVFWCRYITKDVFRSLESISVLSSLGAVDGGGKVHSPKLLWEDVSKSSGPHKECFCWTIWTLEGDCSILVRFE